MASVRRKSEPDRAPQGASERARPEGRAVLTLNLDAVLVAPLPQSPLGCRVLERVPLLESLPPDQQVLEPGVGAPSGEEASHLVVHVAGGAGRRTIITQIAEVQRIDNRGHATLADVFVHKGDGAGGSFAATGHVPTFAEGASPAMFSN